MARPGKRTLALALLAAALLAVIVFAWRWAFVRVEREIELPPIGEAAYNPLYALKKTLEGAGQKVQSRQRLDLARTALGARDTVLMLGDGSQLSRQDSEALQAWVARGGHLVLAAPAAPTKAAQERRTLLSDLGVTGAEAERSCVRYAYRDATTLLFCGKPRVVAIGDAEILASLSDAHGADAFVRLRHGYGSVDVVSDLHFAGNSELDNAANRALLRQLLQPNYGAGAFHLIYRPDVAPLWRLLLERGWPVWIPLLAALLAWLWARTQRFGPLLPSPVLARRSLVEHVQAAGEHMLRYGAGHALHRAVRDAFDARLRRRDPLAASLSGDAQLEAIAARAAMTAPQVREALQPPKPNDGADLRLRISSLIRLRNRL